MATITVVAVSPKKSGATNGRKWTLFEVRAEDGRTFTTFDVEWTKHVGESVEVAASDRNRLGQFPKAPGRPAANGAAAQTPAVAAAASPDRFAVLNEKLDAVLAEIRVIRAHFAP